MKRIFQARFMSPSAVFTEQFSIFHFSIHMVKLYIHCHFRSNKWKICVYGRIKAKYIKSSVWSHFIVDVVVVAFRYSFMIKIAHRGLATSRGVRNNNKKSMYCIKNQLISIHSISHVITVIQPNDKITQCKKKNQNKKKRKETLNWYVWLLASKMPQSYVL